MNPIQFEEQQQPDSHETARTTTTTRTTTATQTTTRTGTETDKVPGTGTGTRTLTRSGSRSISFSRPPSLLQLTEAIRLHNPKRWNQITTTTTNNNNNNHHHPTEPTTINNNTSSSTICSASSSSSSTTTATLTTTTTTTNNSNTPHNRLRLLVQRTELKQPPSSTNTTPITDSPISNHLSNLEPFKTDQPITTSTLDEHHLLLQRRASVSDLNLGLNRTRAPSLAAIREHIVKLKPEMVIPNPTQQPLVSEPSSILPTATTTMNLIPSQEPHHHHHLEPQKRSSTQTMDPIPNSKLSKSPDPSISFSGPIKPLHHRPIYPLQHPWTLYFDSRLPTKKSPSSSSTTTTATTTTTSATTGGVAYEAALQTIGSFDSVEDFCGYFNWTIRPSKMEMQSSVQIFKKGIKPIWEDPANSKGGKWTITMRPNQSLELLDELWTYLVLGLVGEQIEIGTDPSTNTTSSSSSSSEGSLICGAIVATRPRGNRIQIWIKEKENVEKINSLGKRLIKVLEINDHTGVSVEFSAHSGSNQDKNGPCKFISIQPSKQSIIGGGGGAVGGAGIGRIYNMEKKTDEQIIRNLTGGTTGPTKIEVMGSLSSSRPNLLGHHAHSHLGGVGSTFGRGTIAGVGVGGRSQLNLNDLPIQNGVWRPNPHHHHPNTMVRSHTTLGHLGGTGVGGGGGGSGNGMGTRRVLPTPGIP